MIRSKEEASPLVMTIGHSTHTLEELLQWANQERILLMCAEAVPWKEGVGKSRSQPVAKTTPKED